MSRKSWQPLPPVVVLTGNADFLKNSIVKRFTTELFGEEAPEVRRFQGPSSERQINDLPLSTVLDDLRTPSFFTPYRIVLIDGANAFLAAHGESFIPYIEAGFAGGHLLAFIEGKLDRRTRFAKAVLKGGWLVDCPQPYDRPPPWETRAPVWDSELTHWVVLHAREKGLEMDPPTAFALHERAGTDLAVIDEELEKIKTYLQSRGARRVDEDAIRAVVGDLHENSVFTSVELFLEGKRSECLEAIERIFSRGQTTEKGSHTFEPTGIALLFIGAILPRLRSLRRAHALKAEGGGPDQWMAAGLIQRPFLPRFERQLAATSPRRIDRVLQRLYAIDKSVKSGGDPAMLIELLVMEHGQ
jgi:DNA polymerase III delta subunit